MSAVRPTLLLDPANPNDFDPGELEQLAREVEAETPRLAAIAIRRPEEGYGGPLIEVLHIWQEYSNTVGGVAPTVGGMAYLVKRMQRRWRRDRDDNPPPARPRPRVINLYNENSELIRSVKIDLPDGEPVDEDVAAGKSASHSRPKLDWQWRATSRG